MAPPHFLFVPKVAMDSLRQCKARQQVKLDAKEPIEHDEIYELLLPLASRAQAIVSRKARIEAHDILWARHILCCAAMYPSKTLEYLYESRLELSHENVTTMPLWAALRGLAAMSCLEPAKQWHGSLFRGFLLPWQKVCKLPSAFTLIIKDMGKAINEDQVLLGRYLLPDSLGKSQIIIAPIPQTSCAAIYTRALNGNGAKKQQLGLLDVQQELAYVSRPLPRIPSLETIKHKKLGAFEGTRLTFGIMCTLLQTLSKHIRKTMNWSTCLTRYHQLERANVPHVGNPCMYCSATLVPSSHLSHAASASHAVEVTDELLQAVLTVMPRAWREYRLNGAQDLSQLSYRQKNYSLKHLVMSLLHFWKAGSCIQDPVATQVVVGPRILPGILSEPLLSTTQHAIEPTPCSLQWVRPKREFETIPAEITANSRTIRCYSARSSKSFLRYKNATVIVRKDLATGFNAIERKHVQTSPSKHQESQEAAPTMAAFSAGCDIASVPSQRYLLPKAWWSWPEHRELTQRNSPNPSIETPERSDASLRKRQRISTKEQPPPMSELFRTVTPQSVLGSPLAVQLPKLDENATFKRDD